MQEQRKKRKNLRYRLLSVLIALILTINIFTFKTTYVKADDAVTLAEYILTLYASMGVGISDTSILGAFQTHLGSGIAVGTDAIQTAIAACEQAMGNSLITSTFASTAESTAEYVASVGAENLAGATTATATAAQNIGASIANYQSFGFVAPVEGGTSLLATVGMGALAVVAGVAAGFALDKFRNFITPYIRYGLGIATPNLSGSWGIAAYAWDSINPGDCPYFFTDENNPYYIVGNNPDGGYAWVVNNSGYAYYCSIYRPNGTMNGRMTVDPYSYRIYYGRGTSPKGLTVWGGVMGKPEDYLNKPKPAMVSPDVITEQGNANTDQPIELPQKESTPYLEPIPWEVYEPWAEAAKERTKNGETGKDQGDEFQDMTDPYWKPQTDPDGIPQGTLTTPAPVNPAQPTYMPVPTTQPVPTGGVMPEPTSMPQVEPAPTLSPTEQEQTLKDNTIHNLRNFFPFCIPFDLVDMFRKMEVSRKAPVIRWQTDFGEWGSFGEIVLDMSSFDQAAAVCRTFELILFIVGLMVATKNLIGWGG